MLRPCSDAEQVSGPTLSGTGQELVRRLPAVPPVCPGDIGGKLLGQLKAPGHSSGGGYEVRRSCFEPRFPHPDLGIPLRYGSGPCAPMARDSDFQPSTLQPFADFGLRSFFLSFIYLFLKQCYCNPSWPRTPSHSPPPECCVCMYVYVAALERRGHRIPGPRTSHSCEHLADAGNRT